MKHQVCLLGATLALFGAGCAADGGGAGEPVLAQGALRADVPSLDGEAATESVLNELRVRGEVVRFVESTSNDGVSTVLMQELAPIAQGQFASDLLAEEFGHLTQLELFYALGGADAVPHERLVAAHAEEATALQRNDLSVQRVEWDASLRITTKSAATCNTFSYPAVPDYVWIDKASKDDVAGNVSLCLGNNCGLYRTDHVMAGACNDSTGSMGAKSAWGFLSVNNGAWAYTSWTTLPAGHKFKWTLPASTGSKRFAVIGDSAVGVGYRLRTGSLHLDELIP